MKLYLYIFAALASLGSSGCSLLPGNQQDDVSFQDTTSGVTRNLGNISISTAPLELDNAVRLGMLSSSKVASAELGIQQKDNEITIAKAGFYPELYANLKPVAGNNTLASAGAGIRYTLFDFGERVAVMNGSVAAAEGAEYELIAEIEDAVEKTVESYIKVSVENALVQAARSYVKSVQSLEKGVRGRVEIGVASSVDVNELETAKLKANTSVIEARSEHSNARDQLASELGVVPESVWSISQLQKALTLQSEPRGGIDYTAYPRIASLQAKVREARFQQEATSAGLLPRVGLALGVGADLQSGGGIKKNGISLGPEISEVFSLGGGRKQRKRNAQIDVDVAEQRRDEEIRLARLEVRQANTSLSTSKQRVRERKNVLNLTIKTRDVMLGEYDVGTRSLRDLLDAEQSIHQARVGLIEAERENLTALLRHTMAMNLASEHLYSAPQ